MTGAGERVRPLGSEPLALMILPSAEALSTPAVYAEFDALGIRRSEAELAALEAEPGALTVHNDLQEAARNLCPAIDEALAAVARHRRRARAGLRLGPDRVRHLRRRPSARRPPPRRPAAWRPSPSNAAFGEVREL